MYRIGRLFEKSRPAELDELTGEARRRLFDARRDRIVADRLARAARRVTSSFALRGVA